VSEALTTSLSAKEERLAAKKAFEEEQAAAAAAAEAEAAAAEEERLAAEKAAEEEGAEAAPAAPPPAAAPAALLPEASESLYADWKALEDGFLTDGSTSLATVRSLQWKALQVSSSTTSSSSTTTTTNSSSSTTTTKQSETSPPSPLLPSPPPLQRVCSCRKEFYALLTAPDEREPKALDAQEKFNSMPVELRLSEPGKAELHMIATDLQEALYAMSDTRRNAAEKAMAAMGDDGWLAAHALQLVLSVLSLAQAECDRFAKTCNVLHSYCCLRSERALPFTPPPLADLPVPDAVDCTVPVPTDANAPEAAPAKGKADPKAAKGGGGGGATAEATIIAALTALVSSHCEPIEGAEAPVPTEEVPSGEAVRTAEWNNILHTALVGEKAKLRRRLAAILRHGVGLVSELKTQTSDMYAQLDSWLGARIASETAAGNSLVTILRRAVEDEVTLPHALQLQGDMLNVDEALLLLPPPPPPPEPKPAQPPINDKFTVIQLEGLAAMLKSAATGLMLSSDAASAVFCRLGAAGFDAVSPPLPKAWWPLGAPFYSKLTALFCPATTSPAELPWAEVIVALANLTPPSEAQIVEYLLAAASLLGRTELLPSVDEPSAEEGAEPPPPPPPLPPRAGLAVDSAQYAELPLWFETGAVGADGYSIELAFKGLLFSMLSDPTTGKVDLQQLLLYCCDAPEKAFAVLGFATKNMLSIDGLYELLHREPATPGLEPPEHLDPFSKASLKRLFDELKLNETEKAPCPLVAKHPAGAALLEQCISYKPKLPYEQVASLVQSAGSSLMI